MIDNQAPPRMSNMTMDEYFNRYNTLPAEDIEKLLDMAMVDEMSELDDLHREIRYLSNREKELEDEIKDLLFQLEHGGEN